MGVLKDYKIILLDIEGTITSISFVKDKLFGYVRENLNMYLREKYEEELVQNDIQNLFEELHLLENETISKNCNRTEILKKAEEIVIRWMDADKKFSSLKKLQGHMFEEAFHSKAVITEFFPDVLQSIKKLKKLGKKVSIYSSGSILAQKLLFGHTPEGDVIHHIDGFYDTTTGPKIEADSYIKISKMEQVKPGEVLFLTDLLSEAKAAKNAGCGVGVMLREGNVKIEEEELKCFKCFKSMEELFI